MSLNRTYLCTIHPVGVCKKNKTNLNTETMKTSSKALIFFLALSAAIFTGCDKDDDTPDENINNTSNQFNYDDAFGVFVAIKTVSTQTIGGMTIPVEFNTATAAFMPSAGATNMIDGGDVSLNDKNLKKVQNNAYIYDDVMNPLDFSTVSWTASGKGDVPAINKTVTRGFPAYSAADALPESISKASGFSISLGNKISNADSVIVVVGSNNKSAYKIVAGNAGIISFSSADLTNVAISTTGLLSVSPYNITSQSVDSKKYYFINETVYTRMNVNITE